MDIMRAGPAWGLLLLAAAAPQDPPAGREFDRVVQPLVARHCLRCHGEKPKPKADLDLRKYATEASLRADRDTWTTAVRLLNSHEMPPKKASNAPALSQVDRERLVRAVETILNRIDPNAPLDPGRVTIRRLNRTEYGNTVRDLLGVDFNPAEDFPSDDIGHGFDNIGDVLTLSPVLMERYLGAAEALVSRAFPAEPPRVPDFHRSARYLEPASPKVPKSRYRPVRAEEKDPVLSGPLHMPFRTAADGEYRFRFRAISKAKGAKVAVLLVGKNVPDPASDAEAAKLAGAAVKGLRPFRILETVEVASGDPRKAKWTEVKIPPTSGVERLAVALVEGTPEVSVEAFAVKGPLDPRPRFQREALAAVKDLPRERQDREILRRFARRAFRRPATDAETDRLARIAGEAEKAGATREGALGLALQAVLVSPKFLFRAELDDRPDAPKAHPITEHQLASRLSYFVWASTPDEELLSLADAGKLTARLEAQTRRLLADPRARTLVTSFGMQWLQLQRIDFIAPDGGLFPSFNDRLRQSMVRETEMFLEEVFLRDRSVLDLIAADYTFVDDRLGRHYGLPGFEGPRRGRRRRSSPFRRVELKDPARGGLLTQASILTVTSNPTRTSPVKRGKWVLEQILGEPPPPPPPNVPELEETGEAIKAGPLKKRLEQHRADPNCANCHQRMDAIGFALENFDAVGAWRTKDGAFDVDASAEFPDGTRFTGPAELRKVILDRKERFVRCLTEKLMTYALGRGVEAADGPAVRKIGRAVARDGHKFSRLVVEIVKSDPFRLRRGTDVEGAK